MSIQQAAVVNFAPQKHSVELREIPTFHVKRQFSRQTKACFT